jgi:hypothetical protein
MPKQNDIFLDVHSTENIVELNNAHNNKVDVNNANGLGPTVKHSLTPTAKYLIPVGYASEGDELNYNHSFIHRKYNIQHPLKSLNLCLQMISYK